MAIQTSLSPDRAELCIAVEGRFDFSVHQEFRQAYEVVSPAPARYTVNLLKTTYLDSSALGMLLLLRDHAGGDAADVSIVNCNSDVRKILSISNFDQLFHVE